MTLHHPTKTSHKRWIVITGCSSGIGLDAALTLSNRGYRVIATVRDLADAAALKSPNIAIVQLDYADPDSIEAAITTIQELTNGALFALFNNGAYGQIGALEDITAAAMRAQFEANFIGWHQLTRALLPELLNQPDARLIQCSSVLGFAVYPYRGPYNASKHALEGYTDTLRLELHDTNIKVVLIEPGPIDTRFGDNALANFYQTVDFKQSRHHERYLAQIEQANSKQRSAGTLPPSAVTDALIHALEHPKPKIRYRITRITKLVAFAKRLLSDSQFDRLIRRYR